jgi:hypothetical protein
VSGEGRDLRKIRGSGNRELRELLLRLVKAGHRYKMTRAGIIIYGPAGICGTHLENSDHRALRNFSADLRRCGITLEKRK